MNYVNESKLVLKIIIYFLNGILKVREYLGKGKTYISEDT